EFLGVLSHEIRTPLTSLQGYAHLAARRLDAWQPAAAADGTTSATVPAALVNRAENQAGGRVTCCEDSLQRLTRVAEGLADATSIREGQLGLRRTPCDLGAVVHSAVQAHRILEPDRVILFRTGCTPSADAGTSCLVDADADRIVQVVTNYLSNALKYSHADRP